MDKKKRNILIIVALVIIIALATTFIILYNNSKKPVVEGISEPEFVLDDADNFENRVKRIKEAQQINKDVYGWISVLGTNIEYPVVFDQKNDNAYWETKTLSGKDVDNNATDEVVDTVIYASRETKFLKNSGEIVGSSDYGIENNPSKNLVVYGHNWNNLRQPFEIGNEAPDVFRMFAQLPSFTNKDFASENQLVYFTTPEKEYIYRVFSVMYTEPSWYDELGVEYIEENPSSDEMDIIVNEMKKRSIFTFDIPVTKDDNIITLSTCTRYYPESRADQRYVVSAKLISETEKDKTVEVKENKDVKKPIF